MAACVAACATSSLLAWGPVAGVADHGFFARAADALAQAPTGSVGPRPNVGPADRPVINAAAVDRGRRVWALECTSCHGANARGSDQVPSLLHSILVLRDRQGSELGPFLKKGHPTQSGRPSASLTDAEIADVMQYVRQRINDTLRGSSMFEPGDILTGNATAGAAYFAGAGGCTACHSATGDLAKVGSRYNPVDLQQRMLFPVAARFGPRGGGPNRTAITVNVTPPSGAAMTGTLTEEDDFFVSFRDASGVVRTVRKAPGVKVTINDPLRAHHEWLDRVTDADIHNLVAYLVTLK
jgi:mono/diheme cytochrome c family protein